mmetsp:Transcript_110026/g.218541  ORF Transcript_110026/g.218541 Transcript_110026/m.218541 type:complete len:124 (+) Transcript_110026:56-427(+)
MMGVGAELCNFEVQSEGADPNLPRHNCWAIGSCMKRCGTTVHECKACQGRGFHLVGEVHVGKQGGGSSLCYELCGTCHGTCLAPPTVHRKQTDPVTLFWETVLSCVHRKKEEQPRSSKTSRFQ